MLRSQIGTRAQTQARHQRGRVCLSSDHRRLPSGRGVLGIRSGAWGHPVGQRRGCPPLSGFAASPRPDTVHVHLAPRHLAALLIIIPLVDCLESPTTELLVELRSEIEIGVGSSARPHASRGWGHWGEATDERGTKHTPPRAHQRVRRRTRCSARRAIARRWPRPLRLRRAMLPAWRCLCRGESAEGP